MLSRVACLKAVLAGAFLSGALLSIKLWLSERSFPLCPVVPGLPPLLPPFDRACFVALAALLVLTAVLPRPRRCLWALVALAGLLFLSDQLRWQPWAYQYLAMLAALACYPWRAPEENPAARAASLNACRLIVAATYFWSGLQKANVTFVREVYPWLLEPMLPLLPESVRPMVAAAGWACPFVEAAIGLGLFVPVLRPVAVALALAMHAQVLLALGPWGHQWNTVVWPWNVAMMLFVLVLFVRAREASARAVVWPAGLNCQALALVLFGAMPLFSFWGLWDAYLSAALYSGNTPSATLAVSDAMRERLPPEAQAHAQPTSEGWEVSLFGWCYEEMNVPPYPAWRFYRAVARHVRGHATEPGEVILVVQGRPHWRTGDRQEAREDGSAP